MLLYKIGIFAVSERRTSHIAEGIIRVMNKAPEKKDGEDGLPIPPYKLYNIGNNHPENLLDFVNILSKDFNIKEHMKLVPISLNVIINTTASILLFPFGNHNIIWANTLCYYALICSSLKHQFCVSKLSTK